MEQEQFTQRDLQEILGYDEREELRDAITTLRDSGFLRRQGSSFYQKTPAAIIYLRRHMANGSSPNGQHSMEDLIDGGLPADPSW